MAKFPKLRIDHLFPYAAASGGCDSMDIYHAETGEHIAAAQTAKDGRFEVFIDSRESIVYFSSKNSALDSLNRDADMLLEK